MRQTPVSAADLERLAYDRMKPGSTVTEVKGPGIHAWSYGTDMTHVSAWINFDFREDRKDDRPGWKAHVSVDVADVPRAWDAILPVVAAHGIKAKAMTAPLAPSLGNPRNKQAGKTIVLYGEEMEPEAEVAFWQSLADGVETALASAGVRPGWAVRGDLPVPGSAYLAVRNDRDPLGRYSHGIDAFNPFGIQGPFDRVAVTPRDTPAPCGTPVERTVRRLGFVFPGWEHDGVGVATDAGSRLVAGDLFRSLVAAGLPARTSGTVVSLDWADEAQVAGAWHTAMEILRCAELGRAIQSRAHGELQTMTILRRQSLGQPPCVSFEVQDESLLQALEATLSAIPGLGACTPRIDGPYLVLPYGGRFHTEDGFDPHWRASVVRAVDEAFLTRVPSPSP